MKDFVDSESKKLGTFLGLEVFHPGLTVEQLVHDAIREQRSILLELEDEAIWRSLSDEFDASRKEPNIWRHYDEFEADVQQTQPIQMQFYDTQSLLNTVAYIAKQNREMIQKTFVSYKQDIDPVRDFIVQTPAQLKALYADMQNAEKTTDADLSDRRLLRRPRLFLVDPHVDEKDFMSQYSPQTEPIVLQRVELTGEFSSKTDGEGLPIGLKVEINGKGASLPKAITEQSRVAVIAYPSALDRKAFGKNFIDFKNRDVAARSYAPATINLPVTSSTQIAGIEAQTRDLAAE